MARSLEAVNSKRLHESLFLMNIWHIIDSEVTKKCTHALSLVDDNTVEKAVHLACTYRKGSAKQLKIYVINHSVSF